MLKMSLNLEVTIGHRHLLMDSSIPSDISTDKIVELESHGRQAVSSSSPLHAPFLGWWHHRLPCHLEGKTSGCSSKFIHPFMSKIMGYLTV